MSRTRHRAASAGDFDRPAAGQIRTLAWEYPAGWQVPEHHHASHQLVYASRGVMSVHAARTTWVVPASWAIWVPAGVVHAIDMAGEVSMRTLYLARRLAPGLPGRCRVIAVPPLLRELIVHAVGRGTLDRRVAAEARLIAVILDLLRAQPEAPSYLPAPRDARAVRVAALIERDPSEHRTLAELCDRAGGSVRTVQRAFERDTGMTFVRWRQQLRFLHALRRLADGGKVTTVALDVGYDSPSAFVAAFKRLLGTTPGRYLEASPAAPPASRASRSASRPARRR